MYELALTHEAQKFYERAEPSLVHRLNRCFERLSQNPYDHPNIKRLKGDLAGYFRYRIGNWRIIYQINETERLITVLLIVHRSRAYQ